MTASAIIETPLTKLFIEADEEGIFLLRPYKEGDIGHGSSRSIDMARHWLRGYFQGVCEPMPTLKLRGTKFQTEVWKALMEIPFGTTACYSDIAKKIGCGSNRAVGRAIGSNPLMILVPCHRVIGKNGLLTGFAWGLEIKLELLKHEGYTGICH